MRSGLWSGMPGSSGVTRGWGEFRFLLWVRPRCWYVARRRGPSVWAERGDGAWQACDGSDLRDVGQDCHKKVWKRERKE